MPRDAGTNSETTANVQLLQQPDASRRKDRPRKAIWASLAFLIALVAAVPLPSQATVDTDVCSTADKAALAVATCTGAALITTTNEELDKLYAYSPTLLSSVAGTDTITAVSTPTTVSYVDGATYQIKPAATNTGAVTLNINTVGAKALVTKAGVALAAGQFDTSAIYIIRYYQTSDQFRLLTEPGTGGASISTNNNFTASQTLINTGAGSTSAPMLNLYRNSASPAASDFMGTLAYDGKNSGGTRVTYAEIIASILDPTAATEDGRLSFYTMTAGTEIPQWHLGLGFYADGLSDMGLDTLNASDFYDDGANINTVYRKLDSFISQVSDYTTTSQTAAQKIFNTTTNGAFNTVANTTYTLDCWITATGISSSSGTWSFGLGGTAVVTSANLRLESNRVAVNTISTASSIQYTTSVSATAGTAASTTTAGYFRITGMIRATTAGTLIPQTSVSVASAVVIKAGSYCSFNVLGSNAVTSVGNWN